MHKGIFVYLIIRTNVFISLYQSSEFVIYGFNNNRKHIPEKPIPKLSTVYLDI